MQLFGRNLIKEVVIFTFGEDKDLIFLEKAWREGKKGLILQEILEWLELHREELLANWDKAQNGTPLDKIAPLK